MATGRNLSLLKLVCLLLGFITFITAAEDGGDATKCPDGFEPVHRGCFKFTTTEVEFNVAKDSCRQMNAQLTSISSVMEKNEMSSYLKRNYQTKGKWWIGLKRDASKGTDWQWLSKDPFDERVWTWVSEGAKARPGDMCGQLRVTDKLKLHIEPCSYRLPYICEFHPLARRPDPETTMSTTTTTTTTTTDNPEYAGDEFRDPLTQPAESSVFQPCQPLGMAHNANDPLYQRYLQSEIDANNARVAYYSKVARLYEDALKVEVQYYATYQEKLDIEKAMLESGDNCNK